MSLIDEIRIAQRNAGEDAVIRNLERQGLGSINPDARQEETKAPLLPGTRTHGERPDWLQYDYTSDVITIYGLAYHASMFGEYGLLSLEGDLLRITRGPSGTFVLHIVEPSDQQQPTQPQHPDDAAVDRFAAAMKDKLAKAREKGRIGWETCPPADLSRMLCEHVEKGDPRDVANFCMMLWNLGAGITAQPVQEPVDAEKYAAIRESHRNSCEEGYFLARPWLSNNENLIKVFKHGFDRGYDIEGKQHRNEWLTQLASENKRLRDAVPQPAQAKTCPYGMVDTCCENLSNCKLSPKQPAGQSCYCLNCEELSKELGALKTKPQDACCAECGKKDSEGWALYCVECIDKLNALLGSIEQKVDTLVTQTTISPRIALTNSSDKVAHGIKERT